jgi:antitoxin VapB
MAAKAKIFMHGRSQAVRLPKEFRLPGQECRVRREGNAVILEPIEMDPVAWRAELDVLVAEHGVLLPEGIPEPSIPADDIEFGHPGFAERGKDDERA